jgi:hypothetical protein
MIPLSSSLEQKDGRLADVRHSLESLGFTLGGGWDYDHGYFDKALDNEHKVWLRIPFVVEEGALDSETADPETTIRIGTPFVLHHVYNEGIDPEAASMSSGGLLDQFQDPVDPDADVDPRYVRMAGELLRKVEQNVII